VQKIARQPILFRVGRGVASALARRLWVFYSETKPLIFASCALFRGATISNRMDRDCKTSHNDTSWTFENASAFLAGFQPIDRVRQRRLKVSRYDGKPARAAFVR
jgi:hypothetical protein